MSCSRKHVVKVLNNKHAIGESLKCSTDFLVAVHSLNRSVHLYNLFVFWFLCVRLLLAGSIMISTCSLVRFSLLPIL